MPTETIRGLMSRRLLSWRSISIALPNFFVATTASFLRERCDDGSDLHRLEELLEDCFSSVLDSPTVRDDDLFRVDSGDRERNPFILRSTHQPDEAQVEVAITHYQPLTWLIQ